MTTRAFAAAALLFAATTLSAQQYKSLTSVAMFKVTAGKERAFVEKGAAFTPLLDKLMASGIVIAYGMDVDMLHVPGETNVAFWVTVPNYAALEKEETAIQEFIKANAPVMQEIFSMTDPAAHHDLVVRSWEEGHRNIPEGTKPFGDFDSMRVKPGRMEEYLGLFRKYDKPVLDKLVADGVIYGYEIDSEAVHTMEPGLTWLIVTMPDLGAKDKVEAAFDAVEKNMSEADRKSVEKLYLDVMVPGSHRDSLTQSLVFKMK